MERHLRLLSAAAAVTVLLTLAVSEPAGADAPAGSGGSGGLLVEGPTDTAASNDGEATTLRGTSTTQRQERDGTADAADAADAPSDSDPDSDSDSEREVEVLSMTEAQALWEAICYGEGTCALGGPIDLQNRFVPQPAEPADADPEVPAQVVTITDLERFLPATVEMQAEPDGWAVVGVPANFWLRAAPVVVDGELFGEVAQVRFTPQLYRWDYGDGTVRTTATGGASWADLGQQELTATPTGHVYRAEGDLQASVAVVWSAEFRIAGGPWIGVAGAVSSTTAPSRVLVVEERTVLTAR